MPSVRIGEHTFEVRDVYSAPAPRKTHAAPAKRYYLHTELYIDGQPVSADDFIARLKASGESSDDEVAGIEALLCARSRKGR